MLLLYKPVIEWRTIAHLKARPEKLGAHIFCARKITKIARHAHSMRAWIFWRRGFSGLFYVALACPRCFRYRCLRQLLAGTLRLVLVVRTAAAVAVAPRPFFPGSAVRLDRASPPRVLASTTISYLYPLYIYPGFSKIYCLW